MIDYSVYPRTDSPHWWIAYFDASIHRRKCRSSGFRRDDPLGYKHAIERAREWAENGRGNDVATEPGGLGERGGGLVNGKVGIHAARGGAG